MDEKAKDSNATDISCIEEYFATHTDAKTDYDKIGRSILEGTAGWVLEEKSYKAWFEEDTPFLWISGFPGSGKSHLAYFVAKNLLESTRSSTRTSVAYFFFKSVREETRSVKNAFCSVVVQIALADDTYRKQVASELNKAHIDRDKASLELEFLWGRFLKEQYSKTSRGRLYLVLDGLDEADADERMALLGLLADIPKYELQIQVLLLGRPELDTDLSLVGGVHPSVIHVSSTKNAEDIKKFINTQYDRSPRLLKFPGDVREKVIATLSENAKGMFLYVDLMLKELTTKTQRAAVLAALESPPGGLVELFDQVVARIASNITAEETEILKVLLCWVTFAERPLSLSEANSLISIKTGYEEFSVKSEAEDRCARYAGLDSSSLYTENNKSIVF